MRVLIVDDETPARERLLRLLEDISGWEPCGEAATGEQALRELLLSYTPPPDQDSAIVSNLHQQLRAVTAAQPSQRFR